MIRLQGIRPNALEAARPIVTTADIDDVNYVNHEGTIIVSKPGIESPRCLVSLCDFIIICIIIIITNLYYAQKSL